MSHRIDQPARRRKWRCVAISLFAAACACPLTAPVSAADPPVVQWLVATPSSTISNGATTELRWHVDEAQDVGIDQGIGTVAPIGTLTVAPAVTTTYTLTAVSGDQQVSRRQTVVVGPNASSNGGRFVNLIAPIGGQAFTAPATLRVFAAAYDPNVFDGCGADGSARGCPARVDFYLDDVVKESVSAVQSEYWVFKASFGQVGPGRHRVWARAVYVDPPAVLDSESAWIEVEPAPAYAQTIELAQDLVLSAQQPLELIGSTAPGGRIRVNGNGHRIRSSANWSGRLSLRHVDVFDLGVMNGTETALDVSTSGEVRIEDSVFDTSNSVALHLRGTAAATIRNNTFRSNMYMRTGQQPEFEPGASYPAFRASGPSTAPKLFQGNRVGLGWADFRNTDNWLIGGSGEGEGNIVIGPRAGIWVQNTTRSAIRGNLSYHVYFGGWSQGNNMELGGSDDLIVEHNVIGGGSWPIRGFSGILRYNLVLDAGHQWLWVTGDGAQVHHNVFVGGDGDVAPIWLIYGPQNVALYNNTLDGLNRDSMVRPIWIGEEGASAALYSNAIVNMPNPTAIQVDGTLDADYQLFSGQQGTPRNYSDNRHPAHDVGALNAQVAPRFLEPPEPLRHALGDLWSRRVTVRQMLANYRTRYTPAPGSPLIDAGDPGTMPPDVVFRSSFDSGEVPGISNPGNDIGAVGSGVPAADDQFGR